jgi:predicted regulator of Ras-like GTPase activity (Roadblock/LC7/MglB family)
MFESLKKLFSKSASPPAAAPPVNEERIPAPAPAAAPRTATSTAATITAKPGVIPKQTGDMIVLPLNEILSRLPGTLASLVSSPQPGGTFSFPSSIATEQLRNGAVRVPFAQLRRSSPPGTFADNATHDQTLVDLPLPLVLAALGPAGLARRTDQKRMEVPDEVKGVFAAKGQIGSATATSAPAASPPAAKPVTAPPAAAAPAPPKPVTPAPAPAPIPPTPIAPKPSAPVTPISPIAPSVTAPKPTTSIASSSTTPKPASPLPFATTRPEPPPASTAPAPALTDATVIATTVEAVSGAWPEPVRNEVQQFKLGSATISIPVGRLEAGMKSGRVAFTWAELCGWLSVSVPPSANGDTVVELPLKVMAPLFLAAPRAAKPRKVVSVGENVPDLFAGLSRPAAPPPAPAPSAPTAPSAPAAIAPIATPAVAPAVAPPPPAPAVAANVLGEIFGQPSKKDWAPAEIVQKIQAMPGVAGALLSSRDGLLVAGQVPAPLKAEMLAAFLPQMLSKISGSTEEVQLGPAHALRLSTGHIQCAVLTAGKLCLAVLSKPDQRLPETVLERIAAELGQSKN